MKPDAPLRILMVVPYDLSEPGGGVKHHALGLARVLRELGDHVTLAGPLRSPSADPQTMGFSGVVNVPFNGSANRIGLLVNPWSVRRFLRQQAFDVIHVHDPLVPGLPHWMAWLSGKTPKVCTFHAFSERPSLSMRVGQRLTGLLVLRRYQRGIAVSEPARRFVARVWGRPLTVVPNGIQTDVFYPASDFHQVRAVDAEHPLRLFFCARLSDKRKGFADLLAAYRRLHERGVPVTLDVAGEAAGPMPPKLPGLTYHGPVPLATLVERLRACDVFVAPSTGQESFGIVLLEAMATGRAIVCSDIDGYRQVVDEHGAGLCQAGSPESLAAAIEALARDPERRQAMALANRHRALAFEWRRLAGHVRHQYLMAIDNHPEEALILAPAPTKAVPVPAVSANVYGATAQ